MKLLSEVDASRSSLKAKETEYKDFEESSKETARLEEEAARLQGLMSEQLERRKDATSKLDIGIASVYARVVSSGAVAVALVENCVCLGCRTKVRPQLYNEILGFKAVHRCPSCGRLLIGTFHETPPTEASSS